MLAPQSGQMRLRIAEIKFELAFVTKATEAIMSLLFWQFVTADFTKP
jgi:hypothetical protein